MYTSRKTIPLGKCLNPEARKRDQVFSDEVLLRETHFSVGGVGCACWDAAIVLARWLLRNQEVLAGKRVHEVGAGVGLPGLVAARYAERVILSDYVPALVLTLNQNIRLNGASARDMAAEEIEETLKRLKSYTEATPEGEEDKENPEASNEGLQEKTKLEGQLEYLRRKLRCAENLMKAAEARELDWLQWESMSEDVRDSYKTDIILGTEVSYIQNEETLESLLRLINETLSDTGVFYLVQSDDRGTEDAFKEILTKRYGFNLHMEQVPNEILDAYSTGQRKERYLFYTFSRPKSTFPKMNYPTAAEEFGAAVRKP